MIKKDYVITGLTALFLQGYVTFEPGYKSIEVEYGTNSSNYSDKYQVSFQSKDTIGIGTIELRGEKVYCGERLYIELNKFPLENTMKSQAIKNLEKSINPELVKKYYDKLKRSRKNLDKKMIEQFLEKNLMNIKEVFDATDESIANQVLREYLMALLCRKIVPLVIIKGGSAVELYIKNKRATQDIDLHCDKQNIIPILEYLQDDKKIISFKFPEISKFNQSLLDNNDKKTFSIKAFPVTKSKITNFELLIPVEITFNTSYGNDQLDQFINKFKIIKKNLKIFSNAYALVFTKEMLIGEKYQSLISKPEHSTRTKDLIDLANLFNTKINWDAVYDWILIKWSSIRESKNIEQIKIIIAENKDKSLSQIENNFGFGIKAYRTNFTYDACLEIYQNISSIILEKLAS